MAPARTIPMGRRPRTLLVSTPAASGSAKSACARGRRIPSTSTSTAATVQKASGRSSMLRRAWFTNVGDSRRRAAAPTPAVAPTVRRPIRYTPARIPRAIRIEGRRAARSFSPKAAKDRPMSQTCSGGFWNAGWPPQVTVKNAPDRSISTALRA